MIERLLKSRLEPVARRERQVRLWRSLAVCWVAVALTGLLFLWISSRFEVSRNAGLVCLVLVFLAGLVASVVALARRRTDYRNVARKIERDHPDLHALLITAVEQKPDPTTGQFSYLQDRVMREALSEVQKRRLVLQGPATGLRLAHAAHLAALVFALLIAGKLLTLPESRSLHMAGDSTRVKVEPGDVSVEKGTPLFVLARFSGPVPGAATLVLTDGDGETRRLSLERTLGDPVFGGSIPEVSAGFKYFVEFGTERTRDFNVAVFEYPRLERADAEIVYPEYTRLAQKRVEDTRRVTAVEGSQVTVQLQLNKPVRSARLVGKDKSSTPLNIETNKAVATLPGYKMDASQSLALELIDAEGRTNKVPAQFVFDVLKNKPPELKLAGPRGDQRVSPLEEMAFAAEAADDFGLRSVGLTYSMAGKDPATITIDGATARHEKRQFGHMVRLEELRAAPDQLLSWFVWAEDIGPDGQLRRTESDMYFAEVRPLDEIFREGSGAEGESASMGMQMGGQTLKLAELQKQIINATWKIQRQFPAAATKVPPAYKKDAEVVRESQQTALAQAEALSARVDDPRFKVLWQKVEEKMQAAVDRLKAANDAPDKLPPALNAEQEAYQALLTLSAREYQVSRGQRGGGGGGGGERNQRQLDNLELKQDKDRYETQRQAAPQQKPEQREQLAVLSRLKELAQRQQDLNERLKDLQTALREAKTEEERKELERELKRLRDEERELLADIDEVQQTMEKSDNQAQMAESRQQLEETRSHVQNAAEALEKGSVSQALSAGTRAQRELQELRDDFRKKNSNQFAEDMREMRREARELAQTQEEISSKIENETNQKQKALTASDEVKQLTSKFEQQKTGLTNLLQQMREVSEQAEPSEPMLSRQLYDTVRKTSQGNVENNLAVSEELLKRSFLSEAAQFSRRTQEEMNELKRGVEEAASGVLGDEAETLRFAKSELDDLVNKLEQEINESAGGGRRENQDGKSPTLAANAQRDGQTPLLTTPDGKTQQPAEGEQGNSEGQRGQAGRSRENSAQGQRGERGDQETQQGQRQQGDGESGGQQQGEQPGNQNGQQQGEGEGQGQSQRGGNDGNQNGPNNGNGQNREQRGGRFDAGRWAQNRGGGADGGNDGGPLTGGEFREWSERLGQVEEVLDQPDLRGEVARIRDRARAMRAEFKRHSKEPKWDLVRTQVFQPLTELRNRVAEELARVQSTDSLVPIDRDPVPNKFSDLVRRYYEKLGEESTPASTPATTPR